LDLEGVLIPEIWIGVAECTGIEDLKATTRDIPDYDVLMGQRLRLLAENNLKMPVIQGVIDDLGPMAGAREFLDNLRAHFQVVILSDTFYEFARPLMRQLGWPTLFCHRLQVGADGSVDGYDLRLTDHKRKAVAAFQDLNFTVFAAGDSYNDTGMLSEADAGMFFQAPEKVAREFPQFPVVNGYDNLYAGLMEASERFS